MRKRIHATKAGIVAGVCFFTLHLYACATVSLDVQNQEPRESPKVKTFVFSCDEEYKFVARVADQTAWLFLPAGTIKTQKASSQTYRSGGTILRLKGEKALLETPDGKHLKCSNNRRPAIWEHAKLNGADYRAIGNEPGWHLQIRNQSKLILVTDYGSARHEFDLPEPVIDPTSRTTRYEIVQEGQKLILTISGDTCHDSMSGEEFESTVEVLWNGELLRGCGRALH